jgi:glutathione synthase/RimK-type ligase-like ATP-grasp enzyme
MSLKVALLDKFGKEFTEGENFVHYANSFLDTGCEVFQLDPYTIDFGISKGKTCPLIKRGSGFSRDEPVSVNLEGFDIIFDLSDIADLEFAENLNKIKALHINPPLESYASADKKTYVERYPEFIPKTIISSDIEELEKVLSDFGGVMVVKDPLGSGGKGVEKVEARDPNHKEILKRLTQNGKRRIVAQRFLHFASEGGKRVSVIGKIGDPDSYKIIHFYGRKPCSENWKDNLAQGGDVIELENLREDEKELCLNVAKRSGLYAVGLDIMDDLDDEGSRISRLVETNAVLSFSGGGKYSKELKIVPNFIIKTLMS